MKGSNEFRVGAAVIAAIVVVVAGALWLGRVHVKGDRSTYTARFRTVGGLSVGGPVTLRGVRVGQVTAIRLADNGWVETDFTVSDNVPMPQHPAVIAASSSLFGEWAANITTLDPPPDDPLVRGMLLEASRGTDVWPGATLPDIGELTAQASRIAGDVAEVTQRIQVAFDSSALKELRQSVLDLAMISRQLVKFADKQTTRLDRVSQNIVTTSDAFSGVARTFQNAVSRMDTATANNQLTEIVENSRGATADLRAATADFRSAMAGLRENQGSLVHVVQLADSFMTRLNEGEGTLGKLAADSSLYHETTATMREFRELLADVKAHPRRYLKVSVF